MGVGEMKYGQATYCDICGVETNKKDVCDKCRDEREESN